ncbi:MAG: 3-deoxy-7-phosphoheptulonate synthase [Candidatus Micrarchaeaceae archaeon]
MIYKYSWDYNQKKQIVKVGNLNIGDKEIIIAAGPCSVENEEQITETAKSVIKNGATVLRGGAFKPRTSPYSFQGLGLEGLELLKKIKKQLNIPVVTELTDISILNKYEEFVDIIQIGARNSQNFDMLKKLGIQKQPILLKNGLGTTVDEFLMSSEYILANGNENVILCYRGTRSIENATRFSMDIGSISLVKKLSRLPIAVDPSHSAGKREFVKPMALAAVVAGADMLEIEVHNDPENALSDKEQQLTLEEFELLMIDLKNVAESIGRKIKLVKN